MLQRQSSLLENILNMDCKIQMKVMGTSIMQNVNIHVVAWPGLGLQSRVSWSILQIPRIIVATKVPLQLPDESFSTWTWAAGRRRGVGQRTMVTETSCFPPVDTVHQSQAGDGRAGLLIGRLGSALVPEPGADDRSTSC